MLSLPGRNWDAQLARHNAVLLEHHGRQVTYNMAGGGTIELRTILYSGAREEEEEPGNALRGLFAAADFELGAPSAGDSISVDGQSYVVEDVGRPYGGCVEMRLRRRNL